MSDAIQKEGGRAGVTPPALVYLLFFLSGIAALVYEVSWSRLVGVALGNTAQAAALVLAAYFTGLAVGQWLGGLIARRVPPLLGYGVAELAAAAWACLIPSLLGWVAGPDPSDGPAFLAGSHGGRAAWCLLILLPATVPLGTTLPLVIECLTVGGSGWRGPLAYSLNTAGGLVGVVAASAILLVTVGVSASGLLAAALSTACGLAACAAAICWRDRSSRPEVPPMAADDDTAGTWSWYALAAISGFGTLGLEVLYTRMFALVFHNSTYGHGYTNGGHGSTHGGYVAPRVGVYPIPPYGGYYQPGYGAGLYSRPVYSGPVHGGDYFGLGYDRHNAHHNRHH